MQIMFWNIQGIGSKLEIDSIQKFIAKYDIIFLFETMKLDTFDPFLSNYQFHHCQRKYQHPRARRPSGGIGVLINDKIKHLVKVEKINEHVIWISIKQKQLPPLILGGTYIPPAGSKIYLNYQVNDIFQALQADIANFFHSTPLVALCGDFNSRTGGLSDKVTDVDGRDADIITDLNDALAVPQGSTNALWYTKDRLVKDTTHNNFGKDLIQMCKSCNMRIMNGFLNASNTDDFTCYAPLGKSTVDYLLSTHKLSEAIANFVISAKLVESDHVPLTFSVTYDAIPEKMFQPKVKTLNLDRRFQYIFDRNNISQYKKSLTCDSAQDKLAELTNELSEGSDVDTVVRTTYNYIEYGIQKVFKKKQFKAASNTFPKNAWYDQECKTARKIVNGYAKMHDLNDQICMVEYKALYKNYKSIIQRKKRIHQQRNRDELDRLHKSNQTECWKLWNKLTNTQTKTKNTPNLDEFHDYFTKQVHPPFCPHFDQQHMLEINNQISEIRSNELSYEVPEEISVNICDSPITETEVALSLKKLKSNKAAGIDGITSEFYKCIADELTVPFCAIFNYILDKGEYPTQWAEGLINALHKKGDISNPDNYRKITITVAMAKVFDSILNARLYFKNEVMSLDDPFQFGFAPSRGTTDCVFVLDTIVSHQQFKRKPVYLCFVDFTKAFDYINRNALYYKLHRQQMGIKMLKVIMSMFEKAQAKVHQLGKLSAPIDSVFGVLQGGILSPKLFNEFLSDLPSHLNAVDGIEIDGNIFTHLLYADDIVLISESANGLQNSINSLHKFCAKWHLIVNTSKTKVMQIGLKTRKNFTYDSRVIDNVDTFKYLGHTISSQKNIHKKMPEYIATQAQKALFAMQGRMKSSLGHIPPPLAIKMFDSYVLPILEYNCTFWSGAVEIPDIEKIQIGYLKNILGVRRQTPTLGVYAETGRFPLRIRQLLNTTSYWAKIKKLPSHDILHKCLKIQESLCNAGQNNWYSKLRKVMVEVDITDWQSLNPNQVINEVKLKLYTNEQTRILNEIKNSDKHPKLRTYKQFKTSYCLEPYLTLNLAKKTYVNIARFRLSSHNLKIEIGRHNRPKTPVEERVCDKCDSGSVEDEMHCLLICDSNASLRTELIDEAGSQISGFDSLDKAGQFKKLMTDKRPEVIKAIGSFLNKVMI